MAKGLLFIGGKSPNFTHIEALVEESSYIIAADSGYDYLLRNNITPDIVAGDMDSIENIDALDSIPEEKIQRHSVEKDKTDTEIGLDILWEKNIKDITIIGGGGGRLDHVFGIFTLFERERRPYRWITHSSLVIGIETSLCIDVMKGEIISFFPVGGEACEMHSEGLKWPLDGAVWRRGDMGISNEAISHKITVEMKKGRLIMIKRIERENIIE